MTFKVHIEINKGSDKKYEFDEATGELVLDRILQTSFVYPFNYGFIEGTRAEDKDALDAMVISSQPIDSGTVVECRAVGVLEMKDEEGVDSKILAVPTSKVDPEYANVKDLVDVPQITRDKIRYFFEHYKELEKGKWVEIRKYKDKGEAEKVIRECMAAIAS